MRANEDLAAIVGDRIVGTDPDGAGDAASLQYSITEGNADGIFSVTSTNGVGQLVLAAKPSAFAEDAVFSLVVKATDRGGEAGTATFSVTVIRSTEPPQVSDAAFSLDENSAAGTNVGTLVATYSGPLSFSIMNHDSSLNNLANNFAIDGNGVVTVVATREGGDELDYEQMSFGSSATVELVVSVFSAADSVYTSATVTITVVDVNEAPSLESSTSFVVDENTAVGTKIGNIPVTDPDGDTLAFTLVTTDIPFR